MFMKEIFRIVIILILVLPLVNGEIRLNYPQEVKVNEEFNINLYVENFTAGVYDIKIDVNPEKRIAQIYNNGWRSTFYYVNNIITVDDSGKAETTLRMKIVDKFEGIAMMEVRLKSASGKTSSFGNYTILVSKEEDKTEVKEENNSKEETTTEPDTKQAKEETETTSIGETEEIVQKIESNNTEPENDEIIKLQTKDINSYNSKSQNIKEYSIYGFTLFCLIILLLLLIKYKKNKEEQNI